MPSSPCTSFVALLWAHSRTFTSFLNCGAQSCTQCSMWSCPSTEFDGTIAPPDSSVVLCLMHPRVWFALWAARARCWFLLSLLLTSTPQSHSAGLLSSCSSPHLCLRPALFCPRCRFWHLDLLNFIPLIIVQCSSLSRSLCKASCPSRKSAVPPRLVSSANLLMMDSTPASRSLIYILNRTGPRIEP